MFLLFRECSHRLHRRMTSSLYFAGFFALRDKEAEHTDIVRFKQLREAYNMRKQFQVRLKRVRDFDFTNR